MAKWGEGDPRWLVEERPDATNVNNWHWSETDASQWSRKKFSELFVGLKIESDSTKCDITEISKCEGDALVHNRKGRLMFFYDWQIEMKWMGFLKMDLLPSVEGRIAVNNFTEEEGVKDANITITQDKSDPDCFIAKPTMHINEQRQIREVLSQYVSALKDEFSKVILPAQNASSVRNPLHTLNKYTCYSQPPLEVAEQNPPPVENETEDVLSVVEKFKCSAKDFYRAITVPELVKDFTQNDHVHVDATEGGKFELFGGNVEGYFIQLDQYETIKMKWRFKGWPVGHFSEVVLSIEEKSDCVEVRMEQSNIPKGELENIRNGWKTYYWESIERTFGYGAFLF